MTSRLPWLVLVLLAVSLAPVGGASASCAAPSIDITSSADELLPGDTFTVTGSAFVAGCNDGVGTTGGAFGCSHQDEPEPEIPAEDVRLVLRQGSTRWVLGTEDAGTAETNQLGQITWDVRLPADVRPGKPVVLIADEPPAGDLAIGPRITFVVGDDRARR